MQEMTNHDTQSNEDEVILVDEVIPNNVIALTVSTEETEAWDTIANHNPALYTILAQMAANVQEVVDFKRTMETQLEAIMSENSGILSMAMRMFKS